MNFNAVRLLQILILTVSAYYNFDLFKGTKLFGNAASRVLLALGPMLGIGSPYKDLYEIVPPGYLLFIATWAKLFGMSMFSFKSIQVLLILLNGFFLIVICKKLFKNQILQLFVFISVIITVHSRIIQTDFFSIDFFATTLVLGGLASLLHFKNLSLRLSIAATMFVLASQMKEIYILSFVSLLPFYLREFLKKEKKDFFKIVLISAVGPLIILILIISYLRANGVLMEYLQVLQDKFGFAQDASPNQIFFAYIRMVNLFEQTFLMLSNLVGVLLTVNILIFIKELQKNQKTKRSFKIQRFLKKLARIIKSELRHYGENYQGKIILTVTLILSVLYGIAIYGLYSGSQLSIVVTTLYIIIGLLLIYPIYLINKSKLGLFRGILILLILLVFVPKQSVFNYKYYPVRRDFAFEIEKEIMKRVDKKDCILHVHGWEVAATYIYAKRRPCSKYFLSNELFNIEREGVFDEYRNDLFNNPAAAIFYSERGADLNIDQFENKIISMRKILKNCYVPDPKYINYKKHYFALMTLYWPRPDLTEEQLRKCWRENSAK